MFITTIRPKTFIGTGRLGVFQILYDWVESGVKIPIIGMGGIMNTSDAIEFLLAGATAVQVGTAIFKDPFIPIQIIKGIEDYLERYNIKSVSELTGNLQNL